VNQGHPSPETPPGSADTDGSAALRLIDALERRAVRESQSPSQLAAALGVHPSHWYRLRADPQALARCERATLERIARYLDWPFGRVLLASWHVSAQDLEIALDPASAVAGAIEAIEQGPFGTGLRTPLINAAPDHRRLIAELFTALQAQAIKAAK